MIYEAKILKIDNWDEATTRSGSIGPHFFVHYKGWKQTQVSVALPPNDARFLILLGYCRWDEWVPAARLLKFNETNLELAKTLKNASTASTSKNTNKSGYLNTRCKDRSSYPSPQRLALEGGLVPGEPLPLDEKTVVAQRGDGTRMIQTGDRT